MGRKEAEIIDKWIKEVLKGAGFDENDSDEDGAYLAGIIMITQWLEHGYKHAQTVRNRASWMKYICGYPKTNKPKQMDP